jgi:hypothetical protein
MDSIEADIRQYVGSAPEDESFRKWLRECNALLTKRLGLGLFDLPDWAWRDAFEDGAKPKEAVEDMTSDLDM